jgi:hypothetical protein
MTTHDQIPTNAVGARAPGNHASASDLSRRDVLHLAGGAVSITALPADPGHAAPAASGQAVTTMG